MSEFSKLTSENGNLNQTLAGFFKDILEKGVADALLIPAHQPYTGIMQTLFSDPKQLESIDPFAPIVPVNAAKTLSNLTKTPSGRPLAAVMRSCEIRAFFELVKLKQASMDNLLLIGIDCLGRFENADYRKLQGAGISTRSFIDIMLNSYEEKLPGGIDCAPACKICEYPVPGNVDINLCVIGADTDEVYIEWTSERGQNIRNTLALDLAEPPEGRDAAVKKITDQRIAARDAVFEEIYQTKNTLEKLQEHLSGCVNCYNCRVACPVCYCKECVFVTDNFRHPGDKYMSWADDRGALKMPSETLLYHLTRMTHMSTLCVGCGQCTSACPNDIQLAELFRSVAQNTQKRFDYHPGRSLEEPQPLAVFYDNELAEVTGHCH